MNWCSRLIVSRELIEFQFDSGAYKMHLLNLAACAWVDVNAILPIAMYRTNVLVLVSLRFLLFSSRNPHVSVYKETVNRYRANKSENVASSKSFKLDFPSGIFSRATDAAMRILCEPSTWNPNQIILSCSWGASKWKWYMKVIGTWSNISGSEGIVPQRKYPPSSAPISTTCWKFKWNRSHSHSISNLIRKQRHAWVHPLQLCIHKRAHVQMGRMNEPKGEFVFTSK